MPVIGIVDDRDDARDTLKERIGLELADEWSCIDIPPFADINDYPGWIHYEEIAVLIIDEKLNEEPTKGNINVDYYGHDLVSFLRTQMPTLPIFVVTSYESDEELLKRYADVEGIFKREVFIKDAEKEVPRLLRVAQKYLEAHEKELAILGELSEKAAKGKITDKEKARLKAVQEKIGLAFNYISDRSDWAATLDSEISEIEKLIGKIDSFIKKSKSK